MQYAIYIFNWTRVWFRVFTISFKLVYVFKNLNEGLNTYDGYNKNAVSKGEELNLAKKIGLKYHNIVYGVTREDVEQAGGSIKKAKVIRATKKKIVKEKSFQNKP